MYDVYLLHLYAHTGPFETCRICFKDEDWIEYRERPTDHYQPFTVINRIRLK